MNTASCERCGDPAPEPLLRRVELHVDGNSVDDQMLCPDCFAEWISRYQAEMAGTMPKAEPEEPDAGDDITIAEETEPTPDIGTGSNALDQTVASAEHRAESSAQSNARTQRSDLASHPPDDGDDIREVGGETPQGPGTGDGEVERDLDVAEQSAAANQRSPISDDADSEYGDDEDDGLFYPCQRR